MDPTEVRETSMNSPQPTIPPAVTRLLSKVRSRLRRYVILEGIAALVIWLVTMFWVGLTLDYLPVTFGANEMPREARIGLLSIVGAGGLVLFYRLILRRLTVPTNNRSLALLVEKHHPELNECLITTVEADLIQSGESSSRWTSEMLKRTQEFALSRIAEIDISRIFDPTTLWRKGFLSVFLLLSIALFAGIGLPAFKMAFDRLILLDDQRWPRMAQIEIVGVEILSNSPLSADSSLPESVVVPFNNKLVKVARGSSLRLVVSANTKSKVIPRYCKLTYETTEGRVRTVRMKRVGSAESSDQVQFVYQDKPLVGMIQSIRFSVIGYDHKVSDYQIQVVDRPLVTQSIVDATLPKYTGLLPRQEAITSGTRFPVGSSLEIKMSTSKPIVSAVLANMKTGESTELSFDQPVTQFTELVENLDNDIPLEVTLVDIDGVSNLSPHRVTVTAVPDAPPAVEIRPLGIGSSITERAQIQLTGQIRDDYGIQKAWLDVQMVGGAKLEIPVSPDKDGNFTQVIDLLDQQSPDSVLRVQPGEKLTIQLLAQDFCDLDGPGNIGSTDRLPFDIVTPSKLLSLLEGRELDLRRRFEQIYEETERLRDEYVRIQLDAKRIALGPEEFVEKENSEQNTANSEELAVLALKKALDLQRLRIQRAHQASEKANGELEGIRVGFESIHAELTSNRMDTTTRKQRLTKMIIEPIGRLSDPLHAQLQSTTQELEALHDQPEPFMPVVQQALSQTDDILIEMDRILEKMFDLENFNELMEKMRQLIDAQTQLREETEKLRKQQILDLLK